MSNFYFSNISVCDWPVGVKKNSTDTIHAILLGSKSEVTIFTIVCSPGVSDKEVWLISSTGGVNTVAYGSDGMIKVCAAILSVDDTFVVKHNISIGLD
jgi:hypothetical protein